jgi:tetratricopeptide (TPR) repeat protein
VLFFFLNHAIESTVFPLELIFEHRNYLPSLFLFLPIASYLVLLTDKKIAPFLQFSAYVLLISSIVFFGFNTSRRNFTWTSELRLWEDSYAKAPNNGRIASNLATLYIPQGNTEKALNLLKKSYFLPQSTKNYAEAVSLNGQGFICNLQGHYEMAERFFRKSIEFCPDYNEARTNLILCLMKLNRFNDALLLFQGDDSKRIFGELITKGKILLKLERPDEALRLFRSAPRKFILSIETMQGIGIALSMSGHHKQADFYLNQVARFTPSGALSQVENLLLLGGNEKLQLALSTMFSNFKVQEIFNCLNKEHPLDFPLNRGILYPIVMRYALNAAQQTATN